MDYLIHTENACKIYNPRQADEFRAIDGVSLTIARGEVVALKGPSGSGKTTLLSLIGCMGRPTSGRILVAGKDVAKLPERYLTRIRRQTYGFIFQQFNLIRDISVLENILLPLYPQEIPFPPMQERGRALLARLGIEKKAHLKVNKLSGGEQQRVAIARALINDPEILIADEPTAHLDSKLSAELLGILEDINRTGKTIIIATHDPYVFGHPLISRTIAMRDGRILEDGGQ
ncbi:ABC transporter ATP-binding protein [Desulfuromonas sp. KJ2020]|uniref:ABC transporter ATP-binding protein n=1 Tax=Desulfuromonas sp. KJ2020 TaxID=2919173 RepID=UPI0003217DE4|nr:ABC transporter ATP-binding protein [Desulfuromonas sp. KJ2020]